MAPTEQIFAEAKQRPSPPRKPHRPSTVVDANGCTITRGFIIPSRSSSFDSVAVSSTTSSFDAANKPFSLLSEHLSSLSTSSRQQPPAAPGHRPTRSTGNTNLGASSRPALGDRRETWQGTSLVRKDVVRSSRWENDELADTQCKPRRAPTHSTSFPHFFNPGPYTMPPMQGRHVKLAKSAHTKPKAPSIVARSPSRETKRKSSKSKQPKPASSPVVDGSAIATDSEDDQMSPPRTKGRKESSLPRVDKVPYAMRRAMNDARQQCQAPALQPLEDSAIASDDDDEEDDFLPCGTDIKMVDILRINQVTYAERRARSDGPIVYPDPVEMSNEYHDFEESAAASDDEEDEQDGILTGCGVEELSAKLELASIYRKRNSQTAEVEEDRAEQEGVFKTGSSGAKVTTFNSTATITEVRTYVPGTSLGLQRNLRPSRSRPRPAKGVLKSRSHSRSGRSPAEREPTTKASPKCLEVQLEEVAVRFAPAA